MYQQLPAYNTVPYYTPRAQKPKKQTRKRSRIAALLAACMVVSLGCGFGGSYLANNLSSSSGGTGKAVLYQSVIQTANGSDTAEELSVADVAATVQDSVVEITTETVSMNGRMGQLISTGAGSGVIVTTDGYIVTNNHVIADANTITVRLSDGTEYEAALVGTDSKTDLAVLKINAKNLQPAVMGDSESLVVGQTAVAIGNPLGELGGTVTQGIISALDRAITIDGETMSLMQTDTAINPGNSGGGLFNLYGELVGIVNAKSSGSDIEGLGFAIPINTAKTVIAELIENGYVTGRVSTGLTLEDIQDTATAMSYRVSSLGLYVAKSENSQLKSGDRITAIDAKEVTCLADYNRILEGYAIGDTVAFTVVRAGQTVSCTITLTEQTA